MSSTIPASLRKAFTNKKLIPIVGAGVSMSLKSRSGQPLFPSWSELLRSAASKIDAEGDNKLANAVNSMLDIGEYQQAANYARKGLNGSLWSSFFKETFNIETDKIDRDSLALPSEIWKLSKRIITLNYDKVLRTACPCPNDVDELDNTSTVELADFARQSPDRYTTWHLHGKISNIKDIIFTSESYSKLYLDQDSSYKSAIEIFKTLSRDTNFLFVGCSLDDAELLEHIGKQHSLFSENTGPHYALVHKSTHNEIQEKLKNLNITLIAFEDFGKPLIDTINDIMIATDSPHPETVKPQTNNTVLKQTKESSSTRIAILSANPIGENFEYSALLKEFSALKCETHHFPLSNKSLNNLKDFDYIFIASTIIKNKIVIEDDSLQSARCGFKDLETNIGNETTSGVFIFLNYSTTESFETLEFSADISGLKLPTLILPTLDKSQLSSFQYQTFRKSNLNFISQSILVNPEKFILKELNNTKKEYKYRTPLPNSIDLKNTQKYIGRKTDLQNICRKIIELQTLNEILTIKGSGGTGKTDTIKKIAAELSMRNLFQEGIDFIDCEFINDYPTLVKKIAASFNLEHATDIKQQIQENFSKQEKLIILDNVETLLYLTDNAQIKEFISFICDYASIITTSRELLNLECEQVIELSRLSSDEAYELFIKYLRRNVTDEKDQKYIRQELVEKLLDNNPLAIKLVARNTPSTKDFKDLKRDLEDDFFRKASSDELADFDRVSDTNIERKNSIYASINFSYKNLKEGEQMAFELLSLFPDGIDIEALKKISESNKTKQRYSTSSQREKTLPTLPQRPIITDVIIKALEDKSMTQVDHHIIKLQSIVGKFAEHQLRKRNTSELEKYYKSAAEYNSSRARFLYSAIHSKNENRAIDVFSYYQANFIKSISYVALASISTEEILDYLDLILLLSLRITSTDTFVKAIKQTENLNSLFSQSNENEKTCFKVILLSGEYYAGHFDNALSELQKTIPLDELTELIKDHSSKPLIERMTNRHASDIYSMEGESLLELEIDTQNLRPYTRTYPDSLFKIGEFNEDLAKSCVPIFFTLEAMIAMGNLSKETVETCIEGIHEKDHLNLMQCNYVKAKLSVINGNKIDKNRMKKLAIANPYTRGLQQLILAFASNNNEEKETLFKDSLNNLKHIKYYYTEALLHYAKYLKTNILLKSKFEEIHKEGLDLARDHHYRWLQYQFEDLIEAKNKAYCSSDYPLPIYINLKDYIKSLIKHNLQAKTK